jgi:hypothetical protein
MTLDKGEDRISAWLGRQVVAGPKASRLAARGVRRWADGAGLGETAAAELLDMLGIGSGGDGGEAA